MSALIWIGRFYSDIIDSEYLFSGAILLDAPKYKTNLPIYILNDTHNRKTQATSIIDNEFIDFVCKTIKKLIRTNRYSFLCYSNKVAYRVCKKNPEFMDYFICLNNTNLQWLDFKGYTRLWLKRYVKTPPFKVCTKEGCKYAELHKHWSNYNSYIIQEDVSAGGKGSFILIITTNSK